MNKCAEYFVDIQNVEPIEFESYGYDCCVILRTHLLEPFYCGYVLIPSDHPLARTTLEFEDDLDVYGGVTFAEDIVDGVIVGWDDNHFLQHMCTCESDAIQETERLAKQLHEARSDYCSFVERRKS